MSACSTRVSAVAYFSGPPARGSGNPPGQVFGVEIDERVHASIADKLFDEFGVRRRNLILSNCFDLSRDAIQDVNVIVGNPPFIRYQRFSGDLRRRALARAEEQGVRLSELSSSWAPFLVHSSSILSPGGPLAMVVPAEVGYAALRPPDSRAFLAVSSAQFIY